jgi:hypothetical protein
MSDRLSALAQRLAGVTATLEDAATALILSPADADNVSTVLYSAALDIDDGHFFGFVELEAQLQAATDAYRSAEQHLADSHRSEVVYRSALAQLGMHDFTEQVVFGFVGRPANTALDAVLQHDRIADANVAASHFGVALTWRPVFELLQRCGGSDITNAFAALPAHQSRALGRFWNPWDSELTSFATAYTLASQI